MTFPSAHKLIAGILLLAWLHPVQALPDTVRIVSRLDPNSIIITEVDIVFIYDAALAREFPATKKAWYSAKFMLGRSAGAKLDIVNTFIPQGFDATSPPLPERWRQAVRVLVFAQHDASETPAFDITNFTNASIEIDTFGIRVSEAE